MTEYNTFEPGWVSPPGETITDLLAEHDLSPAAFAERIGQSPDYTAALLRGQVEITASIARQLSEVLGGSARFWIKREAQYRADVARFRSNLDADTAKSFIGQLPVNDMVQFGWLPPVQNVTDKAAACLQFFGVPSVEAWRDSYAEVRAAYRTSSTFENDPAAVAAWLRQGELEAANIELEPWNPEKFRATLPTIRALTRQSDPAVFVPELQRLCAACGVAIVIAKAPKKCRASGAVRILPRGRRLILLSFRYLTDDHFWFTFFHEAAHLFLHDTEALLLEGIGAISEKEEREANEFAKDTLVPPDRRAEMLKLPLDSRVVMRFAKDIGIGRGIVVGQLQHAGRFTQQQLNRLKQRYKWEADEVQ
jgi:HTH-type transcriptional regulator / antitoxin HigA